MKNSIMTTTPIATVEVDQMWRRISDQKALVVSHIEAGVVFFYEHGNSKNTGCRGRRQWHEQHYLMGIDDVTVEIGGIF